uniref:ATP-binding cassette domain-containing protein n=1 Tax=Ignavibacterium album TaxID=591197 RepID=A0A832CVU6_9BACT
MIIKLSNISKSYFIADGITKKVINDLSLQLNFYDNKFIALVAPFGSGKTTLLKIISRLINYDSGKIIVNEEDLSNSNKRIVYIPSQSVSIPWLTVEDNIRFELSENISDEKLKFIISLIGLEGYEKHIPHKDSFGFRFRISLGRALASNSDLILIDEPFNKLDSITKEEIFSMIGNVVKNTEVKFLFATSNIIDAVFLSDEIVFISKEKYEVKEHIKIEEKFSTYKELLSSEKFAEIFSNIKSILTEDSGFQLKDFSV